MVLERVYHKEFNSQGGSGCELKANSMQCSAVLYSCSSLYRNFFFFRTTTQIMFPTENHKYEECNDFEFDPDKCISLAAGQIITGMAVCYGVTSVSSV